MNEKPLKCVTGR